jgi:hypothetical protein
MRIVEILDCVHETPSYRSARTYISKLVLGAAVVGAAIGIFGIVGSNPARALPSFARQTGQPCGACHTDFPALTPFGREFKLGGYTLGGGKYRTTLFPTHDDPTKALAAYAKKTDPKQGADAATGDVWVPPISMMAIVGLTRTQADQDPTGSPYRANNNVVVAPVSLFYGGAITEHIGAFAQVTYKGAPFGAQDPADPFTSKLWTWDNIDVRYANTGSIGGLPVTYGITANNNPSVQDPWNTTPAWSFPYAVSSIAPSPGAGTLIDGTFAGHVGGVGAYAWINSLVYVELSGYRTINHGAQSKLGTDPFGAPGLFEGVSPYWRIAVEPNWGNNWLEFGAFGMSARVRPWTFSMGPGGFYNNETFSQSDRYNDIGLDSQYQYKGSNFWITLRGTYIHENQTLDASFANGLSSNPTNQLNTLKLLGSLAYGNDHRIVATGQYFDTWGTSDPTLYGGLASGFSPNSNGFIAELAYIPFINSEAPVWPWANARIGLQYTYFNKFDGTTVNAHYNNRLFLYAWIAM